MGARDYGVATGELPAGRTNSIIDVAGVSVGHVTIAEGELQTGVTAILPHVGNLFRDKAPAACRVINGFGKSAGLVQVAELGAVESPVLLSNTFSVPACLEGGLDLLLAENPDIATSTGSANVVAMECNDGYLSAMRRRAVTRAHVAEAVSRARSSAGAAFERGAVGAGRGMSCYGLKGGIGTASRVAEARPGSGTAYTVGALLLTNFGRLAELVVDGRRVGREIAAMGLDPRAGSDLGPAASGSVSGSVPGSVSGAIDPAGEAARAALAASSDGSGVGAPGAGSVIVVLATDAPLDSRQLRRLCVRAASGLARTGATVGGGSGEIVLAFSTAYTLPHYPEGAPESRPVLHEESLDPLFQAATESVEEAVLDSLFCAEAVRGRDGHERRAILDFGLFRRG
ncbi:MAG: P1 family peptidase [Spirochaetes bacterium]|nr:P1 family peptidase [Spirochaetota bacterium]MBU1080500.1 P1 family peptidase [Spirochaetota bacterium]